MAGVECGAGTRLVRPCSRICCRGSDQCHWLLQPHQTPPCRPRIVGIRVFPHLGLCVQTSLLHFESIPCFGERKTPIENNAILLRQGLDYLSPNLAQNQGRVRFENGPHRGRFESLPTAMVRRCPSLFSTA